LQAFHRAPPPFPLLHADCTGSRSATSADSGPMWPLIPL